MRKEKIYVFDAYGTLFDIDSACRNLAKEIGKDWEKLSTMWRQKQLEYSWLRNSMNEYISFWEITKKSLEYAMKIIKLEDKKTENKLLDLYYKIESYEEVDNFLTKLKKKKITTCILSNGSLDMLNAAINNSKLKNKIDKVLSVDMCKKYKPCKEVYKLVMKEFRVNKVDIIFFSSNSWDVHGASFFGYKTVWVNRFNKPDDILPGKPDIEIKNLNDFNLNQKFSKI